MLRRALRPAALAAALVSLSAPASAAVTRVLGPTTILAEPKGFVKLDAAYDSQHRVYLAAWGTQLSGPVTGILLNESGAPISGVFPLSDGTQQSGWARVIYSAAQGKFLVSYVRIMGVQHHQKVARFVTVANNVASLGAEKILDDWSGDSGTATGMAYSAASGKFLVTWSHYAVGASGQFLPNSFVVTIDGAGTVSPTQVVSDSFDGESDPEIACDPVSRKCLVIGGAWGMGTGGKSSFWARYIDDATGAPRGSGVTYVAVWGGLMDPPAVAHSPVTSQFLMAIGMGGVIYGILGNGSAGSLGTPFTILRDSTGTAGVGYGFLSLRYNSTSQTMLASMTTWVGYAALQEFDGFGAKVSGGFDLIPDTPEVSSHPYDTANQFAIVAPNNVAGGALLLENHYFKAFRSTVYSGTAGAPPPPAPLTVQPLTVAPTSGFVAGNPITFTASATGGTGPYTYQFLVWNGSSWSIGQSYSTTNTFSMSPAAGNYGVQVWVRNSGSSAAYDAWTGTQPLVVASPRAVISSFTADRTFPTLLNVPIRWTATATGAGSPVEFKFIYTSNGGATWMLGQDYNSNNTFTWFPPMGSNNAVQVWVRRVGSGVDPEDWRSTGLFVVQSTGALLASVTPSQPGPTSPSTTLNWTAVGIGGSGPLEYKFFLYNQGTGGWSVLRDWGTSAQASWTPGTDGLFLVQTWVRTVGSGVTYEDWRNTPYFSVTNSTSLTLTANTPLTALRQGTFVTWTAQVGGGGIWEYQFFTYANGTWTMQPPNYKLDNTFSWFVSAGERAVQVWVRPAGSGAAWERWTTTGMFIVNP